MSVLGKRAAVNIFDEGAATKIKRELVLATFSVGYEAVSTSERLIEFLDHKKLQDFLGIWRKGKECGFCSWSGFSNSEEEFDKSYDKVVTVQDEKFGNDPEIDFGDEKKSSETRKDFCFICVKQSFSFDTKEEALEAFEAFVGSINGESFPFSPPIASNVGFKVKAKLEIKKQKFHWRGMA